MPMRSFVILAVVSLALACGCNKQPGSNAPGKTLSCTLEVGGEKKIPNPSEADIRGAVMAMDTRKGGAFLVITVTELTYIQTSGDHRLGFELEFQERDVQHHYRTKRRLNTEEVVKVLAAYATGQGEWKQTADWTPIKW